MGQNFLLDLNITRRIARAAGPLEGKTVLEIGPGPGGLTRALLETGARRVVAVERDARCIEALGELASRAGDRLQIIEQDALTIDPATVSGNDTRLCVVANLPYNIATPLLIGWLKQIESFDRLVLMFQKEVADRLIASPGVKTYGRLSVAAQWRCEVKPLFNLPARAFTPPPKVDSTVVEFVPRPVPAGSGERRGIGNRGCCRVFAASQDVAINIEDRLQQCRGYFACCGHRSDGPRRNNRY